MLSPQHGVYVPYGGKQSYSIVANGGYRITDVLIDGVSVGAVSEYTFTDVTAVHTISATFSATDAPLSATTCTFAADPLSGWINTAQTVTITISDESSHLFMYYASDAFWSEPVHKGGYVNLNTSKPRTSAERVTVLHGKRASFRFRVSDSSRGCSEVVLKLQIKRGDRVLKNVAVGIRPINAVSPFLLRVKLEKGSYSWRVLATDRALNAQEKATWAKLIVK
jgi:hypothetical protein